MADLKPIPKVTNGRRVIQLVALFFILIVLPLGTVLYTNGGGDYFKEMIGELHEYRQIPDFKFAAHNGQVITKEKLKGKLVVAAFLSLDNADAELIGTQIRKLHEPFADKNEVIFLLHTLDPAEDSMEELEQFAKESGLTDEEQCFILTGDQQAIYNHLATGFKWPTDFDTRKKTTALQFGEMPSNPKSYPYFIVADTKSTVKNYYDYKDNLAMARLIEHLALMLPSRTDDSPELQRDLEK